MDETKYKDLIDMFLSQQIDVNMFINKYFVKWKNDRDNGNIAAYDPKFQRIIDRVFTSCDCYTEKPEHPHEISEEELRLEIDLLRHIWWG
ncbi:hypothetical protein GCM10023149_49840 [Mucilaginibacter gynuensis]|uniref:Colicin D immunity protein domain-containing protein n=1 Tax=Mucilaginibacter gynuensis TaxID=1302236 RepID=A0ABP8HH92_9SPHI